MAITIEKYSAAGINKIKRLLDNAAQTQQPRYYEIFVDHLKVVPRTTDLSQFDNYEDFVDDATEQVRVLLYSASPSSPRNAQCIFTLKETGDLQTLNGTANVLQLEERIDLERERWSWQKTKEELEETKTKLTEAEEYIEQLQQELEQRKSKKLHLGEVNLGELASVVLEGMIRRNPQILAGLPGEKAWRE